MKPAVMAKKSMGLQQVNQGGCCLSCIILLMQASLSEALIDLASIRKVGRHSQWSDGGELILLRSQSGGWPSMLGRAWQWPISIRLLIAVAALMLIRAPPAIPPRKASVD